MPKVQLSKPEVAEDEATSDDVPAMKIIGPRVSDFAIIPSSTMGLICGVGKVDDVAVLVPYIQLRLIKLLDEEDEPLDEMRVADAFQGTLAFENTAFLLMDMLRDFRAASARLVAFSSGEMKPEPTRLAYGIECLRKARTAIDEALDYLAMLPPAPKQVLQAKPAKVQKRSRSPKL